VGSAASRTASMESTKEAIRLSPAEASIVPKI
jgi:hypothetical protein